MSTYAHRTYHSNLPFKGKSIKDLTPKFIPLALDVLDDLNLKITFFIVGQDAALDKNYNVLKMLTERGHEVGNHSFRHEPWLHLYPKDKLNKEISETEEHIFRVTGQKPLGFRGPGFSWSRDLIEVLVENEYLYDASTLPTYLGPLARIYYFWKSDLSREEKDRRKKLFGSFKDGLRPVKPHYLQVVPGKKLLEIPVTTIPILKTPFHLGCLIYLSCFSEDLMSMYLNIALFLCRITKTTPSFLLHPLDFMGREHVPELTFFPGMNLSTNRKLEIFHKVINILQKTFALINMGTHAKYINNQNKAKAIKIPSALKNKQIAT